MAEMPYPVMQLTRETEIRTQAGSTWLVWLQMADTDNRKTQFEQIIIRTHVPEPSDDRPRAMELAAIRRVHARLGEQIAAMQSQ
jgi:hypothetical protein